MGSKSSKEARISKFKSADVTATGEINASDIKRNRASTVFRNVDLPTLFHFDVSQEGTLNFREYCALEDYVQSVQKRVHRRRKKKGLLRESTVDSTTSASAAPSTPTTPSGGRYRSVSFAAPIPPRSSTIQKTESLQIPGTPPIGIPGDGNRSPISRATTTGSTSPLPKSPSPSFYSPPGTPFSSSLEGNGVRMLASTPGANLKIDPLDEENEIREEIKSKVRSRMQEELCTNRGRARFLDWMFKFADVEKNDQVSMEELSGLVQMLENDGIRLDHLVMRSADGVHLVEEVSQQPGVDGDAVVQDMNVEEYVAAIMQEYDVGQTGYLTKDEFMVLGEVILLEYAALLKRSQDAVLRKPIGLYKLEHVIGEGSYGRVYRGQHSESSTAVAVKAIRRGNVSDMSRLDVEVQAMKMLDHPNVVKLFDVIDQDSFVYLVMELCGGGSLLDYMADDPLPEDVARYYFSSLNDGVEYCHSQGVCHRDLNLQNMLLTDDGELNISDFGQAGIFDKGWDLFSTNIIGSLYHIAPEQIIGKCYSGEKVDLWNMGVLLYFMLVNKPPFYSDDVNELFAQISVAKYPDSSALSADAKDLISKLLVVDPEKRATHEQIRSHPWFNGPLKKPVMKQYEIDIDPSAVGASATSEVVVTLIEKKLRQLSCHPRRSKPSFASLPMLKCHNADMDVRFCLSVDKGLTTTGGHSMKMSIVDGDCRRFRKLYKKLERYLAPRAEHQDSESDSEPQSEASIG